MLYANTKMLFAGKKFLQHPVRFIFSSEGVNAVAPGSPGETSWSAIPKAFELKDDFLIFYTSERMYTIPKRCFAGDGKLKALQSDAGQASREPKPNCGSDGRAFARFLFRQNLMRMSQVFESASSFACFAPLRETLLQVEP